MARGRRNLVNQSRRAKAVRRELVTLGKKHSNFCVALFLDCQPRNWWLNWSIQLLNVNFTFGALVALPWRLANSWHLWGLACPGRTNDDQITICDLTGCGVQDTAISDLAVKRLVFA